MVRAGSLFNKLVFLLLLSSFIILIPGRFDGDEIFSFWGLVFLIMASFFTPPRRKIGILLPSLLFILAVITLFFHYENKALRLVVINAFVGLLAFKVIAERIDLKGLKLLGILLAVFNFAGCIMLLTQILGFRSIYTNGYEDLGEAAFSTCPWILGSTTALSLPFQHWSFFVFAIPLLLKAHSTSAVLAIFAGLTGVAVKKSRRTLIVATVISLAGIGLFFLYDPSIDHQRIEVWRNTFSYFLKNPWLGHGLGSWAHMGFAKFNGREWIYQKWAHNEFYQYLFEQGIFGFSILIIWLGRFLFFVKDRRIFAALLTLLVLCFFNPVVHFGRLSIFAVFILALVEADITEGSISQPAR